MKFQLKSDQHPAANPTAAALRGYNIETELRAAAKNAVKPLAKRLSQYRAERSRLEAECARWSPESYNSKLDGFAAAAAAGDPEAAAAIENGAVPSRQSFAEMCNRSSLNLENFERANLSLFTEAAQLIEQPMTKVVDAGQEILDAVLTGLGVPRFELSGWRNHLTYVLLQLIKASRNECADLELFWAALE